MIGAVVLVVIMAFLFAPLALFGPGALVAALHGWLGTENARTRHAGSELLELSDKE